MNALPSTAFGRRIQAEYENPELVMGDQDLSVVEETEALVPLLLDGENLALASILSISIHII